MKKRVIKRAAIPAVATAVLLASGGAAIAGGRSSQSAGPDYTYGSPNPFTNASARVHVVHTGSGGTKVTLHVRGADAMVGQRFGAHVHQNPCGPVGTDAGAHYLHAGATGSLEDREVWLDFSVNGAGNGHAKAVRPWSLDESSPRSVIIHADPTSPTGGAGARLACIDLDGQN